VKVLIYLLTLFLIFILLPNPLDAQYRYQRLGIEPVMGFSKLEADPVSQFRFTGGLNLRYSISPLFSMSLNYLYGTWKHGKDPIGREFFAYYYATGIRAQVNLGELFGFEHITRRVHPYASLGYSRMQVMVSNIREREKIADVAADFSGGVNAFPAGLGVRFFLSPRWDLSLNVEYVLHNSDSIDGHSLDTRVYNSRNNPDYIWFLNTGLTYKFGVKRQKGEPHIDWVSRRQEEKEAYQVIKNENEEVKSELDALKDLIIEMQQAQIFRDSLLTLLLKKNQMDSTLLLADSASMITDTLFDDMLPKDSVSPDIQEDMIHVNSLWDSTMMEIVFRAFDSQSIRTDSIAEALYELQEKMNFFLLGYTPKYGRVHAVTEVKMREKIPNTRARIVKVYPVGTTLEFTGYVIKGELIDGNPYWYKDVFGNYFWAGSTHMPFPNER